MKIGEKIRLFRNNYIKKDGTIGLSQKELAKMVKMSEPTIRLYELGLRTPDSEKIQTIASALDVSEFAIADTSLDSYQGLEHALFTIEENYNLKPTNGKVSFSFGVDPGSDLFEFHQEWLEKYTDYKSGKITEEDYLKWKARYPKSSKHHLNNKRKK